MVAAPSKPQTLETLCINSIRFLSIDAVEKAKSGHPGLPMGAAPMAFVLFDQFLKFNPKSPKWVDRDRFVLSAGHGCMLQYSLLHLTGYDSVPLDEIKQFRQLGSATPGHPENFETAGGDYGGTYSTGTTPAQIWSMKDNKYEDCKHLM